MARQPHETLTGSRSSEGRVSGHLLKRLRESLECTQLRLAERLGVGHATVQGWESGRRPLMAMSAGQFAALRSALRRMGAAPDLLNALGLALEVDLFIGAVLATPHEQVDPDEHLLGMWVITRPFTSLVTWPISATAPDDLRDTGRPMPRRGPVPDGPALSADERRHVVGHLRAAAERADRQTPAGLLLARQAYYLLGFDPEPVTAEWLAESYRRDRRLIAPSRGWSRSWPLARSTASALTRLGDPEPMRRFINDQLGDEQSETANLNYWAFWAGDFIEDQSRDDFICSTPLTAWHGARLIRHLIRRLHGNVGFLELNVHSLWALIQVRPELVRDAAVASELKTKIEVLLDENLVSAQARRELEALRYGVTMAART